MDECLYKAHEIIPGIILGPACALYNSKWLMEKDVKNVLSVINRPVHEMDGDSLLVWNFGIANSL
jgi:hypothetical protein